MSDFSQYGGASDEWLAVERSLPPPPDEKDILVLRSAANNGRDAAAAAGMKEFSTSIATRDFTIPTRDGSSIRARSYRPASASSLEQFPTYIHFHGGGFVFGTLDSEDAICSRIALSASVVVLNVCYRHTPEHKYPTAWNDSEDAFLWAHRNMLSLGRIASQVIVGGISAGAWLTASLVLGQHLGRVAKDAPPIAGQVLMIPCLVHERCYEPQLAKMVSKQVSSYTENEYAPILPLARSRLFLEMLDVEEPKIDDLRLNPGNATPKQIVGLPPAVFGIAGLDILRDEGLLYAKMLAEAGVATNTKLFHGVPHGFRRFGEKLSASASWDDTMAHGILWTLSRPGPLDFMVHVEQ